MSSGGPIMMPDVSAYIINPICPHALFNRAIVLPEWKETMVKVLLRETSQDVMITIDGQAHQGGEWDPDGFVTKYAADGAKQWTRMAGGTNSEYGLSVATAADGSVYLAGTTNGSINGQANLGNDDGFVIKYAADGTKQWTRMAGGPGSDQAYSVATAADGSVYVAGQTNGSIDGQANHGDWDSFVTKYAADGTQKWTRLAGGTNTDAANSVATAADGSVYIAGFTSDSIDEQANLGGRDAFVTKLVVT
jgi:hypothetical protein